MLRAAAHPPPRLSIQDQGRAMTCFVLPAPSTRPPSSPTTETAGLALAQWPRQAEAVGEVAAPVEEVPPFPFPFGLGPGPMTMMRGPAVPKGWDKDMGQTTFHPPCLHRLHLLSLLSVTSSNNTRHSWKLLIRKFPFYLVSSPNTIQRLWPAPTLTLSTARSAPLPKTGPQTGTKTGTENSATTSTGGRPPVSELPPQRQRPTAWTSPHPRSTMALQDCDAKVTGLQNQWEPRAVQAVKQHGKAAVVQGPHGETRGQRGQGGPMHLRAASSAK